MKIVVGGGTGFIGEPLCAALVDGGAELHVLTRDRSKVTVGRGVEWHPPGPGPWQTVVADADVVINLSGENVGEGRWTERKKGRLRQSRVDVTRSIVEALRANPRKHRRLINASAVGYYGDRGEEILDERAGPGTGFLSDLGMAWEQSAREGEEVANVTILRFAVVIGEGGGVLAKMLPVFRLGLGGKLGSGKQWMAWVARSDLIRFVKWILEDPGRTGVYNVASPRPVRNEEFTRILGEVLHRPTVLRVPKLGLRLAFGEMADEMLLASQRVIPKRGENEGFSFEKRDLRVALSGSVASE